MALFTRSGSAGPYIHDGAGNGYWDTSGGFILGRASGGDYLWSGDDLGIVAYQYISNVLGSVKRGVHEVWAGIDHYTSISIATLRAGVCFFDGSTWNDAVIVEGLDTGACECRKYSSTGYGASYIGGSSANYGFKITLNNCVRTTTVDSEGTTLYPMSFAVYSNQPYTNPWGLRGSVQTLTMTFDDPKFGIFCRSQSAPGVALDRVYFVEYNYNFIEYETASFSNRKIFAVGNWSTATDGLVNVFNGEKWVQKYGPVGNRLDYVHGSDVNNVWIVGRSNTVLNTTDGGETYNPIVGPAPATNLTGVHVFAADNVYVTASTDVYQWNGAAWASVFTAPYAITNLFALSTTDILIACYDGATNRRVYRYDGGSWNLIYSGSGGASVGLWASGTNDLWLAYYLTATTLTYIERYNGAAWNLFWTSPGGVGSGTYANAIHGTGPNDVWVSTKETNSLYHWDGLAWTLITPNFPDTTKRVHGIWAFSPTEMYTSGVQKVGSKHEYSVWNGTELNWTPAPQYKYSPNLIDDWGMRGIYGFGPSGPVPIVVIDGSGAGNIAGVFVIAKNVIKVNLSAYVATAVVGFNDPTTYTITSLDTSNGATVQEVFSITSLSTNEIYLRVSGLKEGERYRITTPDSVLYDIYGEPAYGIRLDWLMTRTKVDSVIDGLSNMYDTSVGSNLRGIVEAIMISDEEIGGDF